MNKDNIYRALMLLSQIETIERIGADHRVTLSTLGKEFEIAGCLDRDDAQTIAASEAYREIVAALMKYKAALEEIIKTL